MSEKKEYIERGVFADYLREQAKMDMRRMIYYEGIIAIMYTFSAADVEPVVRGEWRRAGGSGDLICTNCKELYYTNKYDFCPSCGAVMTEAGLKKIAERSGSGE